MFAHHERQNALAMQAGQLQYDHMLPDDKARDEMIEVECNAFAKEFIESGVDDPDFYKLADDFACYAIGEAWSTDDQQNLLQLILKANQIPELKSLCRPFIQGLKEAAYKHKEKALGIK